MMTARTPGGRRAAGGFTIVELMTALAVIALLAAMAAPTMRAVVQNSRIRSAGNSIQNGLALARSEAVRQNTQVEFAFTPDGWEVRRVAGGAVLHQAAGMEVGAGGGLVIDTQPAGTDRITFNAFGLRMNVNPADDTFSMSRIDIEAANPTSASSYRPLAIQLTGGGAARLCDPNAAADQPRACL